MRTIFLNPSTWDLTKDAAGNIAVAEDPYSMAQDAASAIKLVQGEQWYDTTIGIKYSTILAQRPNLPLMKALFATTALTVLPAGSKAVVFLTSITDRRAGGQVQVTPPGSAAPTAAAF
jgi:hypothetical protein